MTSLPAPRLVRGSLLRALLFASAACLAVDAARADPWPTPSGWFVQYGNADETHAFTTGATWNWKRSWPIAGIVASGYWEASVGLWHLGDPPAGGRQEIAEIGFTPVFRIRGSDTSRWFAEAAIGVHLIAPKYRANGKRFSTTFNFGDHVGVGYCLDAGCGHELALRYQHFSNGSIRKPNPGEDFIQLRYQRAFGPR